MNSEQELQREKKGHSDDYDPKEEEKKWGQEMYAEEEAERRLDPFVRVKVEKLKIPEYRIQKRIKELIAVGSPFKDDDEKLRAEALLTLREDMLDRALDILLDVDRLPDEILGFLADDNLTAANQDEIKKAVMVCLKSSRVLQFIMDNV